MENSTQEQSNSISLKGELYRKAIHFFSSAIPLGYLFIAKDIVLWIITPLLFLMLLAEFFKYRSEFLYGLYIKYFGQLLREHEADRKLFRISGASWVLAADVLCTFVFPKYIAITGMLMLSFSDSLSGILGRLYGRKLFAPNRSYVGTLTFFFTSIIIVLVTPKYLYAPVEYYVSFSAAAVTTAADSLNLGVDDNLVIPLVYSGFLYLMYLIFLPSAFIN